MKQKNTTHQTKRIISPHKFARLFNQNLDKVGYCYRMKNWNSEVSLQAVKIDNIIYAKFGSVKGNSTRLNTYCLRYKITENGTEDFAIFYPFPVAVF